MYLKAHHRRSWAIFNAFGYHLCPHNDYNNSTLLKWIHSTFFSIFILFHQNSETEQVSEKYEAVPWWETKRKDRLFHENVRRWSPGMRYNYYTGPNQYLISTANDRQESIPVGCVLPAFLVPGGLRPPSRLQTALDPEEDPLNVDPSRMQTPSPCEKNDWHV